MSLKLGTLSQNAARAAAGIVAVNYGTVDGCKNYANISSTSTEIGGIVGHGSINTVINECFNNGNISAVGNLAGGIVGRRAKEINNCYNYIKGTTEITANGNTAGLIANCSDVGVEIKNCYCIGDNINSIGSNLSGTVGLAIAALYNTGITVNKFYYLDTSTLNVYGSEQVASPTEQNVVAQTDTNFKLPSNNSLSVAYLLNPATGTAIWGQDNNINDGYPYLVNNN